ncbi:MAG: hypothetical protein H0T89_11855 [Deltaproteobacteria bacterium]|nr:hypothetical protein [Deltaproteobacteria bacterium]MDQ3295969.1 hypothetical protein [Myxococcota bacterium]
MRRACWLAFVLGVGCADEEAAAQQRDCETMVEKMKPLLREQGAQAGITFTDADWAARVTLCRERAHLPVVRENIDCIKAATDDVAVRACLGM